MSLIYVGPQQQDKPPKALMARTDELKADGKLLEAARADFGVLFREMDAFIVHGGLGSTVEAMRMKKPVCVTGILLMDQRFWGKVCHEKGIGPPPVHIDDFHKSCVDFVDEALDPQSSWLAAAATLEMGDEADDGVAANVNHFAELMESGLKPVRACRGSWVEAADQCRVSRSSAAEAEAETASAA
jgi:sterol 3beta-glucosyltransferase